MPLFIIPTPIGNLKDITVRALDAIRECNFLVCEDTRRTGALLSKLGIKKKMTSLNEKNERKKTKDIIQELESGKNAGLITDNGTPLISDPGYFLTRESIKKNIKIIPLPGPSASITALAGSGFPTDRFLFAGFLTKKPNKRKEQINEILKNNVTTIIYESPYRLLKTLKDICDIEPERELCICREMTKIHEEFIRGNAKEIFSNLENRKIKGEITIIISKNL